MINIGLLVLLPFMNLFSLEVIHREGIINTLNWIRDYLNQFIIAYAILFGLINIFYILPRRIYMTAGFLFLSIFSIAALVSREKLLLRGEPLLPWDFKLGREALTITQSFEKQSSPQVTFFLLILLFTLIALIGLLMVRKEKYQPVQKITTAILSCFLFVSLIHYIPLEKTFAFRLIITLTRLGLPENADSGYQWRSCH